MELFSEGGRHRDAMEVYASPCQTDEECGQVARLDLVGQAVCRFLNAGGDWDELEAFLRRMRAEAPYGLHLPDNYVLRDIVHDSKVEYQFIQPGTTNGLVWVEDEFVESTVVDP